MNKEEVINKMSEETNLPKADSKKALESFLNIVQGTVSNGGEVRIIGHGTYSGVDKKETMVRNPKTGETFMKEATRVPKFKPGKAFKDAVSNS